VFKALYNVFFHRLSAFKGPRLYAASDIPLAILQLRGVTQYTLREAHERYDDVVRIGPTTLSFIAPSAWNDIYGYRNGIAVLPKDTQFYNEMLLARETISMASDRDAVPIRRAMNTAFSHKALLEQEPMLQTHVQRLISRMSQSRDDNGAVDLRKWFTYSIFDINSDFAFGEDMGCVASGALHDWAQFVVDFFYAATLLHQCHKFKPLNRLLALCIPRSVRERQKRHHEASLQRVHRRMSTDVERPDFMHYFVQNARKEELSEPVIEAQASVIILAGSETTSVALTAAAYFVLSHPHVYEKLCKEIRHTFARREDIGLRDVLSKLPYLVAVVQERLRLHAPLANGFGRVVPDSKGAMISGYLVPKGVSPAPYPNYQTVISGVSIGWHESIL
jgi:cytochrome P450